MRGGEIEEEKGAVVGFKTHCPLCASARVPCGAIALHTKCARAQCAWCEGAKGAPLSGHRAVIEKISRKRRKEMEEGKGKGRGRKGGAREGT